MKRSHSSTVLFIIVGGGGARPVNFVYHHF